MSGLCTFIEQINLWPHMGTGMGLIDPIGAEGVKRMGVEHLVKGFIPPPSTRILSCCVSRACRLLLIHRADPETPCGQKN